MKTAIFLILLMTLSCTRKPHRKELSTADTTYNLYKVELLKGAVVEESHSGETIWRVATIEGINQQLPEIKEEGILFCENELSECLKKAPQDKIILREFGSLSDEIIYDDLYIEETRKFKASRFNLRSLMAHDNLNQVSLKPGANDKEVEVNITLEKSCQVNVVNFNSTQPLRTKWIEASADCFSPTDLEFVVTNNQDENIKLKKTPELLALDAKFQAEKNKKLKAIEDVKNKRREKILKGANELLGNLKLQKSNDSSMSKLEDTVNLKTIAYLKYLKIGEILFTDKCFKAGPADQCREAGASIVIEFENKKRREFVLNSAKIKFLGIEVLNNYSSVSIGKSGLIRISERNFKKNQTNENLKKKALSFEKLIERIILDEYINEWKI